MAEENKDEELEKTVEQKEAPVSLEIKPEKIETLDETLKKGESGKEEIISKAVKEIGDEKKALKIHGANSAQIGEFNKGRKKVEEGVINAEGDFKEEIKIVKGNTAEKEATDAKRGSRTEKEIMEEVEKINEKIDEAIRKGLNKEEEEFRKERERLLSLFGNKYDDIGAEAGQIGRKIEQKTEDEGARHTKETAEEQQEPTIKKEALAKTKDKATEVEEISEKAGEDIKKNLKDPTSELSILVKAANFEEDYMLKLEKDLEKAKASKVDREEGVRFYEKSIAEHKVTLKKHKKRIKEIINEIEEKNKKISPEK